MFNKTIIVFGCKYTLLIEQHIRLNVLVALQFTQLSDYKFHCLTILLPKKYFLTSNLNLHFYSFTMTSPGIVV